MPTLTPLRQDSTPQPPRRTGSQLWMALVTLIAVGIAALLWNRASSLESQLVTAERHVADVSEQLRRVRSQSESARDAASRAIREADQEAAARQQAELARELSRERAERAELDSERASIEAQRSRQEAQRLIEARRRELDRMKEALSRIAETSRTPLGMVVNLGEDRFLFDFDKATLRPENRELLSRIAGVLLASHGYSLYVYGHTDDVGDPNYNQGLSERRAESVRNYLVEAGVPAEIIESKGFGAASPRVRGTTRDARQKNRRVEIGVVDTVVNYDKVIPDGAP